MSDQTFLFADLAGFTALTEVHGDQQAVALLERFAGAVHELLPTYRAEAVKSIGDALMLRSEDAAQAVRLGFAIVDEVGARHEFPSVRVGMHSGPAVERDGDWFGSVVNLAARISGLAAGGEVLLSAATRAAAGELAEIEFRAHGQHRFKNISEPVTVYAAHSAGARDSKGLPIDPVCRMAVEPQHAAGSLNHENRTYYFCSLRCAAAFAREPEAFT